MVLADSYASDLERQPNWQATAKARDGHYVVIMRGHQDSEYFTEDYHIFDGENHIGSLSYKLNMIVKMFTCGDLKILRGSILDEENPPSASDSSAT
jgi:hypothetical protein